MNPNFLKKSNFLVIIITVLISCNKKDVVQLNYKESAIEGLIEDYNGDFKGGKLTYFDCISRIIKTEIFSIDSSGLFKVNYTIPHPIYESVYLDLQGKYYDLYLEPGKNLKIKLKDRKLHFPDSSGLMNKQLKMLDDTIYAKFRKEIDRLNRLHETKISYKEYIKEVTDLKSKKLSFIDEFEKSHNFENEVYSILREKSIYAAAKSWINFRHDYSTGRPRPRDTLFTNFYEDLFNAYPTGAKKAMPTREYIDYIANIASALSGQDNKESNKEILKKATIFSEKEIELIEGVQNGDTTIIRSEEWEKFFTPENRIKLTEIAMKYYFGNILRSCSIMPKGLGRDLIISQGLSQYYFSNIFIQPSDIEWATINKLVVNKSISDYLLDVENHLIMKNPKSGEIPEIPSVLKTEASSLNNDLIGKYKGKVIYLDFWATWCGPCRREIPDSKLLIQQFKNKAFMFIAFCCQSSKQVWQNMVAIENLEGIQLYLNDMDYNLLSSLYNVKGFPTYVLIDKLGKVTNYNALGPSTGELLFNEINKLIEQ